MPFPRKQLFQTFILLIVCLLVAYSAVFILLGNNSTLDIALYYTYYIFSPSFVILGGTLLLFFMSSLVFAGYHRFSSRWWNGLSILSVIVLFIFIYRIL